MLVGVLGDDDVLVRESRDSRIALSVALNRQPSLVYTCTVLYGDESLVTRRAGLGQD